MNDFFYGIIFIVVAMMVGGESLLPVRVTDNQNKFLHWLRSDQSGETVWMSTCLDKFVAGCFDN